MSPASLISLRDERLRCASFRRLLGAVVAYYEGANARCAKVARPVLILFLQFRGSSEANVVIAQTVRFFYAVAAADLRWAT
jgi:hypothetical protein